MLCRLCGGAGRCARRLIDPRSGHLHPLKYTRGLARAGSAGVVIFRKLPGAALRRRAPEVRVHTQQGTVRAARSMVLCCNIRSPSARVAPTLARRILGVGTYVVATEPLGTESVRMPCCRAMPPSPTSTGFWITRRSSRRPPVVRRTGQLQLGAAPAAGRRHAQAHGARIPLARRREGQLMPGAATSASP